ncbi:MAG TPA: diaminopimelate epimerase [Candidatus Baltobacteraceae bacterium]|nr:diaminopimelate epimerase [Candidatus Baltobacteraceae bacterium]
MVSESGPSTFIKVHGAHNDFVLIDERPPRHEHYDRLAREVCDRHEGLGADGLLVVHETEAGDAGMRIFNADGSEAEMCGNGIRCVARYLAERGFGDHFRIATQAGTIETQILARQRYEYWIRVKLGIPELPTGGREESVEALDRTWSYIPVSLGNPHIVVPVPRVGAVDVAKLGRALATHPRFPGGTNVHFVEQTGPATLNVRHYERGVGVTQACGTGVVASAVAFMERGALRGPAIVVVPGGLLAVRWERGGAAFLDGPAVVEYERTLAP